MSDIIHNLFIDTEIKAADSPVRDQVYGQLNISVGDVVADAYREAVRKSILDGHDIMRRHFEKIIANMPPPPDPFWKEWQL